MKKYIGILKFDNGTRIPAKVEAKDKAEALLKIATYCTKEGYFPRTVSKLSVCLIASELSKYKRGKDDGKTKDKESRKHLDCVLCAAPTLDGF